MVRPKGLRSAEPIPDAHAVRSFLSRQDRGMVKIIPIVALICAKIRVHQAPSCLRVAAQ